MTDVSPPAPRLTPAAPFWLSLALVPLAALGAAYGGWTVFLLPVATWGLFGLLDALVGEDASSADPATAEARLFWHKAITLIWTPVQFAVLFGMIYAVTRAGHLAGWERAVLFVGVGVISGTVGITYAHELVHQRNRAERWLGDILLAMVLYGHFRSEHLLVHHRHVGTPRDPVTARLGEGFFAFWPRVLWQCVASAFAAERAMLARRGLPWWHRGNPFWRYAALQAAMLALAAAIGGWEGLALFLLQAFVAIWQLELVNYVEHYGLSRRHLGGGKYEPVRPRHSWNATHQVSNWLLINLQRHSDHHYKPDRRFPLLQTYDEDEAPHLPYGYPAMTILAMVPPLWRRVMDPRVHAWRRRHYPDVEQWPA